MKNSVLLYFSFFIFLFSCKSETSSSDLASQLTVENMGELLPKIQDQFQNWTGSSADLAAKSEKVVGVLTQNQKFGEAMALLSQNISGHYNQDVVVSNGGLLANIYETVFRKNSQANMIRQSIATNFPESGVKYNGDTSLEDQISAIGKQIFDTENGFNRQIAQEFVTTVENFALMNPKSETAPKFLIDAATISGNLGSGGKTLELFRTVYQRFPNHKKAGDAKFYEAFTYDSNLKDYKKAEVAYKAFIAEYPEHEFVDQANVMLQNLGKSDEELLKSLGK